MEQEKSVSQRLKEHLDSITLEEFQKEWKEIEEMGFEGPTVQEFLENQKKWNNNIH